MLEDFIAGWPLFAESYISGWCIAALLSMIGVVVVGRDQIFIGAAVSQASTLGVAVAMVAASAAHVHLEAEDDARMTLTAAAFAVGAALATAWRSERRSESHEAVTGWVFLASASGAILVVAHSPHGLEEVHRLLASSILGATALDVAMIAGLAAATALGIAVLHRPLRLLMLDPEMAAAVGMKVGAWNLALAAWLGLCLGVCLHVSGMLYGFGCLVLPAMAARNLCRRVGPMFWLSPLLAVACSSAAFVIANAYDDPPGQMAVALMALMLPPAWLARRLRRA
jgi:ABC-type Mn2+/Zn2+ transport system permease subunit